MSIGSALFLSTKAQLIPNTTTRRAEYLFNTDPLNLDDPNYYSGRRGFLTYFEYFILLNTLIPISLIVSLEFVKLIQTPFLSHDLAMFDPATLTLAHPVSMTLHEELASVKYIFADKTGTLTANIMQFKASSIAGICYDEQYKHYNE